MKKELTRAALISAGLTLLLPFLFGVRSPKDYLEGIAFGSFFISLLILLCGLVMVCIRSSRKNGQAFLLCAAVLLLISFTLCSSGAVRIF